MFPIPSNPQSATARSDNESVPTVFVELLNIDPAEFAENAVGTGGKRGRFNGSSTLNWEVL
jgi:hypothetical protein